MNTEKSKPACNENKLTFRQEVLKRWKLILFSPYALISAVLSIITTYSLFHLPGGTIPIKDVASYGITFSALSFAACITAVTVFISLPSSNIKLTLVRIINKKTNSPEYYEMIFVPLWAATSQLILVLICVINIIFGGNLEIAPKNPYFTHYISLTFSLIFFYYALLELLNTVGMFSRVSKLLIQEMQNK